MLKHWLHHSSCPHFETDETIYQIDRGGHDKISAQFGPILSNREF